METTGYPCPACGAPADLATGCSGCGRPPYPSAAEVIRLDREIVVLGREVERARRTYQEVASRLQETQRRRAELAARIRAELPAPGVARPVAPVPGPLMPVGSSGPSWVGPATPLPAGRAETSTRTVQNLLFVLGGLLLGTAAVVFTAVAWAAVGVAGRAVILAAFTALALAVPLVAARRRLTGTAETFAAVGLLLVVLDGYAAWSVDLLGVTGWPATRYAALVGGASAAVAAGYARLSRLTVPWFAALLAGQPVLPLLALEARPSAAVWAMVFTGVALLDLAVVAALRRRTPAAGGGPAAGPRPGGSPAVVAGRTLGWLGYGGALTVAAACALVPFLRGRAAGSALLAGLPLLVVALVLLGGALLAGGRAFRLVAAGLLVPVLAGALVRPVAELRMSVLLVAAGLITVGLAGAVRLLPDRLRTGPGVGALVVAGSLAQLTGLMAGALAGAAVARSLPPWRGAAAGPDFAWGWQLPVTVALTAVAVAVLLPRAARPATAVSGVALTVLAAPAVGPTPWPAVVAVGLATGAALLLAAVVRPWRRRSTVLVPAVAGAALLGHALLVALAAPVGAGTALGVVLAVGLTAAARGRGGAGPQPVVAGVALVAGLLAVPAGAVVALIAAEAPSWWQARAALAAVGLLAGAVLAVRRHWPDLQGYASTGLAVAVAPVGLAPVVVPGEEPVVLYAALGVLLTVLAGPGRRPGGALRVVGIGLLVVSVLAALPLTLVVLVPSGDRAGRFWSGAPTVEPVPGALSTGLALLVLALVAAAYSRAVRDGRAVPALAALPFGAVALPVLLAAAGAPWPAVPAVALGTGLAALLAAALVAPRPLLAPVTVPVGLVTTAAGLAGLLATRAGTLAGLGVLVVASTVVGVAGRRAEVRLAGCLVAVAAATGFAVTAPLAGGLPLRAAAFAVLGVAVLVLAVAPVLTIREPVSGRATDAAAQAVALVALLLTVDAARYAAAVCVLWGAAVALRVLRRGEPVGRRWLLAGIAGGSELLGAWLLLAAGGVVLLEAYTVPAAALALGAGVVALRTRPGLTSWLALGPGLAAALLPSLVSVLVAADPQPWRRLLLGAAALVAVLTGAARRWQAPVLLGGVTLALLALHELVRSWDLLPRWIFLAIGGLALIGLAATYERRRRDLARLRSAVGRMG